MTAKGGNTMKYSVWSYYLREFSPEEQIEKYLDCGFQYAELSDEDGFILLDRGPGSKVGAELKSMPMTADSPIPRDTCGSAST